MKKNKYRKHSDKFKEKVFNEYVLGDMPKEAICRKFKISKRSLYRWEKDLKWRERKKKIDDKAREMVDDSATKIKSNQMKIINAGIVQFLKDLKEGNVFFKPTDVVSFLNHQLKLNDMDKDLHTGLSYQQTNTVNNFSFYQHITELERKKRLSNASRIDEY